MKREVFWRTECLEVLDMGDRYSRDYIMEEFTKMEDVEYNENTRRIHNDGEEDFFITIITALAASMHPCYFSWELDTQKNHIIVFAVGRRVQPKNRKELKLITHISHLDRFAPKWPWQSCKDCNEV